MADTLIPLTNGITLYPSQPDTQAVISQATNVAGASQTQLDAQKSACPGCDHNMSVLSPQYWQCVACWATHPIGAVTQGTGDTAQAGVNQVLGNGAWTKFTNTIQSKDFWKGAGLVAGATGLAIIGLLIFAFAPSPQGAARTGVKTAAKAAIA